MEQQLKTPVIVALKGQPCSGKTTVARSIAAVQKWTLINQDDLGNGDTAKADEFNYKTVCRIASAQLQFGINVIIDSPFCHQSHLDQLLQLSTATGARLVIVECKSQDKFEWRRRFEQRRGADGTIGERYKLLSWTDIQKQLEPDILDGDNNFSKLIVNTTRYINDSDLCRAISYLATCECISANFDDWRGDTFKGVRDNIDQDGETGGHVHELVLAVEQKSSNSPSTCLACLEPNYGPIYNCNGCNFSVHKLCAELPKKTELEPQDYPPFLKALPSEYSFPEKPGCSLCEKHDKHFSECPECLFKTNLRQGFLPSVVNHISHRHSLCLAVYPRWYDYEFQCQGCGDLGKHLAYQCSDCNYVCHTDCVMSPYTIAKRFHHHVLFLLPHTKIKGDEEFYCHSCEERRNPNRWMYYCASCDYQSHLKCE